MAKKKVHAARKSAGKGIKKKVRKGAGRARPRAAVPAGGPAAAKAAAVALLNWVHQTTESLINGIPAEKACFQTAPTDNHLIWTIGHLSTGYSWFASLIDGKTAALPESYDKLFGYKSVPAADVTAYPPLDEVKRHYAAAYKRFTDAVAKLKPADLLKPTVSDSHGFASSRLDVIHKTVWHEGWHSGQLSSLRRALGLPSLM